MVHEPWDDMQVRLNNPWRREKGKSKEGAKLHFGWKEDNICVRQNLSIHTAILTACTRRLDGQAPQPRLDWARPDWAFGCPAPTLFQRTAQDWMIWLWINSWVVSLNHSFIVCYMNITHKVLVTNTFKYKIFRLWVLRPTSAICTIAHLKGGLHVTFGHFYFVA